MNFLFFILYYIVIKTNNMEPEIKLVKAFGWVSSHFMRTNPCYHPLAKEYCNLNHDLRELRDHPYHSNEWVSYPENVKTSNDKIKYIKNRRNEIRMQSDVETVTLSYLVMPTVGRYKGIAFNVQLEYNPAIGGAKNEGYWMGYIRNETKFERNGGGVKNNIWVQFGFSNYRNQLKYILRGMKRYLLGEKFFIRNDFCIITPEMTEEDINNMKNENKKIYKEEVADKIAALKNQIASLEAEYNSIDE